MNYYNEFDKFAADWLRNLIAAGEIPKGEVDERSITEVKASDLKGYTQAHFFAGIGGWPLALRLVGWPEDRPVFTGSCPCQPLSSAGLRKGHADERHLWPAFYNLIAECRPATVFGEQVASADGREWFAGIRADLEGVGYAVGGADLCAAGIGAPHIRQRLYWVADSRHGERGGRDAVATATAIGAPETVEGSEVDRLRAFSGAPDDCPGGGLEHPAGDGRDERRPEPGGRGAPGGRCSGGVDDTTGPRRLAAREGPEGAARDEARVRGPEPGRTGSWVCDTDGFRLQWRTAQCVDEERRKEAERQTGLSSSWADAVWIPCADGKARRLKSGLAALVDGLPYEVDGRCANPETSRKGLLKGLGNAIVPELAAEFVRAFICVKAKTEGE